MQKHNRITYYQSYNVKDNYNYNVSREGVVCTCQNYPRTYDALDRPVRQYLPVPADDDSYMTDVSSAAVSHYGDSHPFARMTYCNMAGDKPLEVIREGEKMQDHPERYEYLCNNTADAMLRCRRYRLAGSADSESITLDGDYPAGALDVTRVTDPDGCMLLTFTDWRGLTMLERRVVSDTEFADTYYLYDILGNVRVILQPEGAAKMASTTKTWTRADDVIDQYAFINRYDRRGNCVYTKVPGAGPVEMRYDPLNRLAFRQTATMAEQGEAEFTLYDPIGRIAITGIATVSLPNTDIPTMTATYAPGTVGRDSTGYTVPAPFYHINLRTTLVNYYDSYDFATRPGFSSLPADNLNMNASISKGQVTGSRTAILDNYDTDSNIYSIVDYNTEEHPVSRIESTVLADTYLHNTVKYTNQGYISQSDITLSRPDSIYVVNEFNSYDALGNPTNLFTQAHSYPINQPATRKVEGTSYGEDYIYNNLGQLEKTRREMFWDNVTQYTYNMRGQVASITTPAFTQALKYDNGESPCYNGNISEMTVAYNGETSIKRNFTYDRLNRLIGQTSSDGYNTAYSYNLNSSPLTVMRKGLMSDGTIGTVDDLMITYTGNHLTKTVDSADPVLLENSMDFAGDEAVYSYDSDGRLYSDTGRDIEIGYNKIDRPTTITTGTGESLTYTYAANGQKLAEHYIRPELSGAKSKYYIGPFEFIGNHNSQPVISRINTRFGYFTGEGAPLKTLADYQGNIRAVVNVNGTAVQTTDYYPYGLPMATSTGAAVNRYKYGGKELETRSGLNLYDFIFRLQTPAECSFGSPDPKATSFQWLSPYSFCGANPINNIDQFGDSIQAVSKVSGARLLNVIHTTFDGPKFKDLRRLFKLNRDGMTMQSINSEAFDKAINGLSSDEKALAKAYYLAINSSDMHLVDLCLREEKLSKRTIEIYGFQNNAKGKDLDYYTGGINRVMSNGSSTIVVMDSKKTINYVNAKTGLRYNRVSYPGETLSHELLGHGLSREEGSISYRHEDAIQMTNLFWRVKGKYNFYRDGSDHFNKNVLDRKTANDIPNYLK